MFHAINVQYYTVQVLNQLQLSEWEIRSTKSYWFNLIFRYSWYSVGYWIFMYAYMHLQLVCFQSIVYINNHVHLKQLPMCSKYIYGTTVRRVKGLAGQSCIPYCTFVCASIRHSKCKRDETYFPAHLQNPGGLRVPFVLLWAKSQFWFQELK